MLFSLQMRIEDQMNTILQPGPCGSLDARGSEGIKAGWNGRTQSENRRGRLANRPRHRDLIRLIPVLVCVTGIGCKTFNYTAADVEKERRQLLESRDTPFGAMCNSEGRIW